MFPLAGSLGPLGRTRVLVASNIVTRIRAYPRASFANRLTGMQVYGSNNSTFPSSGGTLLTTLPTATNGVWLDHSFSNSTYYKWVWLHQPATDASAGYTDVAELEFYGGSGLITPATKVSSGGFGGGGTYDEHKAFDGDTSTFFASAAQSGTPYTEYIGISISP